jgi:hypothetical protein
MRPGLHKGMYMDCPHCAGAGEVRVPDAVAADILRRVALLFSYERIARAEVVCSSKVAAVFLASRRHALHDLEERTGKKVDMRISEAFAADRVDLYAYDDRGADIELERLPTSPRPTATMTMTLPRDRAAAVAAAAAAASQPRPMPPRSPSRVDSTTCRRRSPTS